MASSSTPGRLRFLTALSVVVLVLLLPSLAASCQRQPAGAGSFQVVRVIDGDTVVVEGGMRVRYIGIDAPEMDERWGEAAKEANRSLVEGKRVRLERDVSETDRFGRWLRYVYVDGLMVNAELPRLGLARARPYPPDVKHQAILDRMESEARQARRGIWTQ
ncbi:MAG: thermonuclease family protein [Chloroflexi bacterium]|nr:thermonuclease family protein [Chloroflexota bacterium]